MNEIRPTQDLKRGPFHLLDPLHGAVNPADCIEDLRLGDDQRGYQTHDIVTGRGHEQVLGTQRFDKLAVRADGNEAD
jgi:hypothetical protein